MELTEFVRARLAEEHAAAEQARWAMQDEWFTDADDKVDEFVRQMSPARVLAQVAAMRAIVVEYERLDSESDRSDGLADLASRVAAAAAARDAVRHFAAIWREHDDYDPAWAPEGE